MNYVEFTLGQLRYAILTSDSTALQHMGFLSLPLSLVLDGAETDVSREGLGSVSMEDDIVRVDSLLLREGLLVLRLGCVVLRVDCVVL